VRRPIKSIDELDHTCRLVFGGNGYALKRGPDGDDCYVFLRGYGECFYSTAQVEDFIRWGAITKAVEPTRFEGVVVGVQYLSRTPKLTIEIEREVVALAPIPHGMRVLVTEIPDTDEAGSSSNA